jgi:hypothetical protein
MGLHAALGQLEELGDLGQGPAEAVHEQRAGALLGCQIVERRPRAGSTHSASSFASVRNRDIGVGRRIRRVRD